VTSAEQESDAIEEMQERDMVAYVFFEGRPRFFFVLDSPEASPAAEVEVAAIAASCGLGSLRGRPRLRFAGGSSAPESSGFFSLGGLPLFLFTFSGDDPVGVDVTPDFLFLLPLGRPRPLLALASFGSVAPSTSSAFGRSFSSISSSYLSVGSSC